MTGASMIPFSEGVLARIAPADGEKVLWIHGYTMDSSLWEPVWRRLPGWHHVGIDLPGHGASAPLSGKPTLGTLARAIGEQALAHDVRHIVGISFGGMVALQVAIEFPTSFASLTLGAPGLAGGPEEPTTPSRYRDLFMLYGRRGPGPWMRELWMQSPPDLFKGAAAHPALWQELVEVIDRHAWYEIRDYSMQHLLSQPQTAALLQTIQTPTLVLVGEEEMPAFKETAALICQAIPLSTCRTLPQAGHLSVLEVPDIACEAIRAHWQSHRATVHP